MSFPAHEVYTRCLLGHRGCPLWFPEPPEELPEEYQREGLKIGDLGLISHDDGSFDVLFNITLPRNRQPHRGRFVREGFTPILLEDEGDLITKKNTVGPNISITSKSVKQEPRMIHGNDQRPKRADYGFSLSTKEDGAVLVLPEGAQSCSLRNQQTFLDEAIRSGLDWYECATRSAGRRIDDDSLYLITGFHKASSWALAAAGRCSSSVDSRCSVKFTVGHIRNIPTAEAYCWDPPSADSFMSRTGPSDPYETSSSNSGGRNPLAVNQTIFIQGFRIMGTFSGSRFLLANCTTPESMPFPSSAGTEPAVDQDSPPNSSHIYLDSRMAIDRVPEISKTFHPGDCINRYMLKKEPLAMVAITHDELWIKMLHNGLLKLSEFSDENRLWDVLSKNYKTFVKEDAVYLQSLPMASSILGLICVTTPSALGSLLPAFMIVERMTDTYEYIKFGQGRCKDIIQRTALVIKDAYNNSQNDQRNISTFERKLERIHGILQNIAAMSFFKALLHFESVNENIARANDRLSECSRQFQTTNTSWHAEAQTKAIVSDREALQSLLKLLVGNYHEIRHRFGIVSDEQEDQAMVAMERELRNDHKPDSEGEMPVEVQIIQRSLECIKATTGRSAPKEKRWLITEYDLDDCGTIGGGGFSTVSKARFRGVMVAVKTLKDIGNTKEALEREIEIWSNLRHDHIVPLYGASTITSPPFIVCRYMQKGNLLQYLATTPEVDRTKLLFEVSLGMYYLHEEKIVHGNLKGVNVLVDDAGKACITDFGLSKMCFPGAVRAKSDRIPGTLRFLAPEALKGSPLSFETDVYAFGMLIYEVFTEEVPFTRESDNTVLESRLELSRPTSSVVSKRGFNDALWELHSDCISFEPFARPRFKPIQECLGSMMKADPSAQSVHSGMEGNKPTNLGLWTTYPSSSYKMNPIHQSPPPVDRSLSPSRSKVLMQREYREKEMECFNALRAVMQQLTGEELQTRHEILRKAVHLLSRNPTDQAHVPVDPSISPPRSKVLMQRGYCEKEGEYFNALRAGIQQLTGEEPHTRHEILRKAIDLLSRVLKTPRQEQLQDHIPPAPYTMPAPMATDTAYIAPSHSGYFPQDGENQELDVPMT